VRTLIGGVTTTDPFREGVAENRTAPAGRVADEGEQLLAPGVGLGFQRPPEQQRQVEVGRVLFVGQQRAHDGDRLAGRQAARAAGELTADFDVAFPPGERGEFGQRDPVHLIAVTQQTHSPATEVWIGMMQLRTQAGLLDFSAQVEHPEGLERVLPIGFDPGEQGVPQRFGARGEQATGLFPQFAIGMGKQREQCRRGLAAQVARARQGASGRRDAVDAPGRLVPGVGGIQVTEPEVGPIGDVDRAVGAALQVDRPEGAILARDQGELYRRFGTSTCRAGGGWPAPGSSSPCPPRPDPPGPAATPPS
jgi:hypothetical protein